MINYEYLLHNNIINKQQFLINNYNLIDLDEVELVIVLLIQNMLDINELVTTQALEQKMSIANEKIEKHLGRLIEKNLISFDNYSSRNTIDTSMVFNKIIDKIIENNLDKENDDKLASQGNLINVFEKEFKRKLSPIEIETIKEWSTTFNNELVVYALKESVMYGVLNLKYIEKIIVEQAKLING